MTHVIFKEFHLDREVPYFRDYAKKTTDLPCLVRLRERDGAYVADRFLRASDLGESLRERRLEDRRARHRLGVGRGAERVDRVPLGRGGDGEVEPRARTRSTLP